jgi:hypothetical protein
MMVLSFVVRARGVVAVSTRAALPCCWPAERQSRHLDLVDGVRVVFAGKLGHTAFFVVGHGAAQVFEVDLFAGDRLDHLGTGDEHVAGVFDHENKIGHGRRIDRAAGRGAHDGRNLGNHAGGHRVAVKDLAVAGQGIHAFLDAGAARIVEADEGHPGFEGHVHDLADLLGLHLTEAARPGGKILGKGEHRPAVHQAVSGNHTVGGNLDLRHAEIDAAVLNEHVDLPKGSLVEQLAHPFAGGQLAFFLVLGDQLFSAHLKDARFARLEILDFFLHNTHVIFLSPEVQNHLTSCRGIMKAIRQLSTN